MLFRSGVTVVLSSHFLPQIEEWCDSLVMLVQGRALFRGTQSEVRTAGGLHRIYVARMKS